MDRGRGRGNARGRGRRQTSSHQNQIDPDAANPSTPAPSGGTSMRGSSSTSRAGGRTKSFSSHSFIGPSSQSNNNNTMESPSRAPPKSERTARSASIPQLPTHQSPSSTNTMLASSYTSTRKRARAPGSSFDGAADDEALSKGGHSLRKRARIDYTQEQIDDDLPSLHATKQESLVKSFASSRTVSGVRARKKRTIQDDSDEDSEGPATTQHKHRRTKSTASSPRKNSTRKSFVDPEPDVSHDQTSDEVQDTIMVGVSMGHDPDYETLESESSFGLSLSSSPSIADRSKQNSHDASVHEPNQSHQSPKQSEVDQTSVHEPEEARPSSPVSDQLKTDEADNASLHQTETSTSAPDPPAPEPPVSDSPAPDLPAPDLPAPDQAPDQTLDQAPDQSLPLPDSGFSHEVKDSEPTAKESVVDKDSVPAQESDVNNDSIHDPVHEQTTTHSPAPGPEAVHASTPEPTETQFPDETSEADNNSVHETVREAVATPPPPEPAVEQAEVYLEADLAAPYQVDNSQQTATQPEVDHASVDEPQSAQSPIPQSPALQVETYHVSVFEPSSPRSAVAQSEVDKSSVHDEEMLVSENEAAISMEPEEVELEEMKTEMAPSQTASTEKPEETDEPSPQLPTDMSVDYNSAPVLSESQEMSKNAETSPEANAPGPPISSEAKSLPPSKPMKTKPTPHRFKSLRHLYKEGERPSSDWLDLSAYEWQLDDTKFPTTWIEKLQPKAQSLTPAPAPTPTPTPTTGSTKSTDEVEWDGQTPLTLSKLRALHRQHIKMLKKDRLPEVSLRDFYNMCCMIYKDRRLKREARRKGFDDIVKASKKRTRRWPQTTPQQLYVMLRFGPDGEALEPAEASTQDGALKEDDQPTESQEDSQDPYQTGEEEFQAESQEATAVPSPEPLEEEVEEVEENGEEAEKEDTEDAAEEREVSGVPKMHYLFPMLRDPEEFGLYWPEAKRTEELYERAAYTCEALLTWQMEYQELKKIVDDEENAKRRQANDKTIENWENRLNLNDQPVEQRKWFDEAVKGQPSFEVRGARAPKPYIDDPVMDRQRTNDRVQAQAWGFKHNNHPSLIGNQKPDEQRWEATETRLRDRRQTQKAADLAEENVLEGKRTRKPRILSESKEPSRATTPIIAPTRRKRGQQLEDADIVAGPSQHLPAPMNEPPHVNKSSSFSSQHTDPEPTYGLRDKKKRDFALENDPELENTRGKKRSRAAAVPSAPAVAEPPTKKRNVSNNTASLAPSPVPVPPPQQSMMSAFRTTPAPAPAPEATAPAQPANLKPKTKIKVVNGNTSQVPSRAPTPAPIAPIGLMPLAPGPSGPAIQPPPATVAAVEKDGEPDKPYAEMSKSEKMSWSMRRRWANGEMKGAVEKRKSTLAKKAEAKAASTTPLPPTTAPAALTSVAGGPKAGAGNVGKKRATPVPAPYPPAPGAFNHSPLAPAPPAAAAAFGQQQPPAGYGFGQPPAGS